MSPLVSLSSVAPAQAQASVADAHTVKKDCDTAGPHTPTDLFQITDLHYVVAVLFYKDPKRGRSVCLQQAFLPFNDSILPVVIIIIIIIAIIRN